MKTENELMVDKFLLAMASKDQEINRLKGEGIMPPRMRVDHDTTMVDEDWGFFLLFLSIIICVGLVMFAVKVSADRQVAHNLNRIATVMETHK